MPLLLSTSSYKTKTAVIILTVLSILTAVTLTFPSVTSCFLIIYENTVFLLKPPYLYLVLNFIIIAILATSKLTSKSLNDSDISQVAVTLVPIPVPVPSGIDTGYLNVTRDHDAPVHLTVEDTLTLDDGEDQTKPSELSVHEMEKTKPEIPVLKNTRKPPRSSQQKMLKSASDGGNKQTMLGVTKPPRRQDTLETTWKKITEGRETPLKKHLKKSDTWQERSHVQNSSEKLTTNTKSEKLTTNRKSEKLVDDINAPRQKTQLKREPSPGQEELNRRVEAFIKKFNEEMRLQRLESLAKYNEIMLNGGT